MTDAKHAPCHLAQPHTKRHVVPLKDLAAQGIGVVAFGHEYRGQRTAVLDRVAAEYVQAPAPDRAARRFRMPIVAGEDTVERPLERQRPRLLQAPAPGACRLSL